MFRLFILTVACLMICQDAEARRFGGRVRGRIRPAAQRVVETPRRVIERADEWTTFDGNGEVLKSCGNPDCTCIGCDCIDCQCGAKEAAPASPSEETTSDFSGDESRMVAAINRYRAAKSLPPLSVDPLLMRIARQRVGVFDHNQPRYGGFVHQQLRRLGWHATDNIAQGYSSPEQAVGDTTSGWGDESSKSIGHNRQMLGQAKRDGTWRDLGFDRVGVAREGRNYIAIFGKRNA